MPDTTLVMGSDFGTDLVRALMAAWFNGRRYPDDNDEAGAALVNLDLGVDAPAVYRRWSSVRFLGLNACYRTGNFMDGLTRDNHL